MFKVNHTVGVHNRMIETPALFFIVGCGRSGTTLLQSICLQVPAVMVGPETKFFGFFPPSHDLSTPQRWQSALEKIQEIAQRDQMHLEWDIDETHPPIRDHKHLFQAWLHALGRPQNAQWIGDASNVHTPHILRLAHLFPQAKIIHLFRDPRDVVASQYIAWQTSTVRGSLRWYRAYQTHLLAQHTLSEKHYFSLRYEDLVQQPQKEIQKLCTWMGWTYQADLLHPHLRKQTGFAPRENHKRGTLKPITSKNIGRYKERLCTEDLFWIETICAEGMKDLGYQPHTSPSLKTLKTLPRYIKQGLNLFRGH